MRKGKIIKCIIIFFNVFMLIYIVNIFIIYNWMTVSNFTIKSQQIKNPIRIVFVSDLHEHEFGEKNYKLVNKMKEQKPDLILLDGDIINADSKDSYVAIDLIKRLKMIAPVYYSLGNHEYEYMENGKTNLIDQLKEAGANVLNYGIFDLKIKGNNIRMGGIYEYGFETSMQTEEENKKAVSYMKKFTNTERYLIMCAHRPESFYCWDFADKWKLDLVLSGHLHGGQVIIPVLGGLYSPLEGFFPKYDYGEYDIGHCKMMITRGLSSNKKVLPRFNNPPEIAVVDIKPDKK